MCVCVCVYVCVCVCAWANPNPNPKDINISHVLKVKDGIDEGWGVGGLGSWVGVGVLRFE